MEWGETLTRWTARLAWIFYIIALSIQLSSRRHPSSPQDAARWAWTLGCAVFLAHVTAAFQYYHHWSHTAAYEATAQRTADVTNFRWGGGLYGNYLFLIVWAADTLFWWIAGHQWYLHRSRGWEMSVQSFLGFMFFNATLVFGQGLIRWLAVGGLFALALAWWHGRTRQTV